MNENIENIIIIEISKLIQNNNIYEFKNYIKSNEIQLKQLKSNNFDILIKSIEYDASVEIIKCILNYCDYCTLNYSIYENYNEGGENKLIGKTPLSEAIKRNNFKIAETLINFGADINYIPYSILKSIVNINNSNFIIEKGISITTGLLSNLIKDNINFFLRQLLQYYYFNNIFILNFLSIYRNKLSLSTLQLKEILTTEQSKLNFSEAIYALAIEHNNYTAVEILYNNDPRERKYIYEDLYNIYLGSDKEETLEFLDKFKTHKIKIKDNEQLSFFLNKLEILISEQEKKETIMRIIKNHDIITLKTYIIENNIPLLSFVNKFNRYSIFKNSNYGIPLFSYALKFGDKETVQYFIDNEVDINKEDQNHKLPLIIAIKSDSIEKVKCLIDNGVEIKAITDKIVHCLKHYYQRNRLKILKILVNHGFDIDWCSGENDFTLLTYAVNESLDSMADDILKCGVNVDKEDGFGRTALAIAIKNENDFLIYDLIEWGADIDKLSDDELPLNIAIQTGNRQIVETLVDAGANINGEDLYGNIPLTVAICKNDMKIIKYLINKKVDVNKELRHHKTPLHVAIEKNKLEIIKYLVKAGATINMDEKDDNSHLNYVIKQNKIDILNYFKEVVFNLKNKEEQDEEDEEEEQKRRRKRRRKKEHHFCN